LVAEVKVACCRNMWDNFMFTGAGKTVAGEGVVLCEDMISKASPSPVEVVSFFRELSEREANGLLEVWVLSVVVGGSERFVEPERPS
jgi:hypothetical protein